MQDDYAPVDNAVFIGVIETVEHRLSLDDSVAFVETWPPDTYASWHTDQLRGLRA